MRLRRGGGTKFGGQVPVVWGSDGDLSADHYLLYLQALKRLFHKEVARGR